jgi:hypothetical protein
MVKLTKKSEKFVRYFEYCIRVIIEKSKGFVDSPDIIQNAEHSYTIEFACVIDW